MTDSLKGFLFQNIALVHPYASNPNLWKCLEWSSLEALPDESNRRPSTLRAAASYRRRPTRRHAGRKKTGQRERERKRDKESKRGRERGEGERRSER